MTAAAVQAALLMLCAAAAAFYGLSAYCTWAFFRRPGKNDGPAEASLPPVTILKPIRGADDKTTGCLLSFIDQDYPCFQVVFGIADRDDPAREVVEKLIAGNPGKDLELAVGGAAVGPNQKVSNLHNIYGKAKHDIIVIADSDMRVGPDYLREVVSGFADPSVGLVTCPYRGVEPEGVGGALEALTINTDFMPSVFVAERLEGLSFALGATMAVRREALEKIGGFKALAEYLADDYQLGSLVKKAGFGLRLSGYLVDSVQGREGVRGYLLHQLRWGRTYRACRPKGYFLWVLTRGTAFSLLFLAATGFSTAGWAVALANISLRYAQAFFIEAGHMRGPGVLGYFWLVPVMDVLSFVIWFLSFTGDVVTWKDARYRIDKDGRMLPLG